MRPTKITLRSVLGTYSTQITPGDVTYLTGPNASGKSTHLRCFDPTLDHLPRQGTWSVVVAMDDGSVMERGCNAGKPWALIDGSPVSIRDAERVFRDRLGGESAEPFVLDDFLALSRPKQRASLRDLLDAVGSGGVVKVDLSGKDKGILEDAGIDLGTAMADPLAAIEEAKDAYRVARTGAIDASKAVADLERQREEVPDEVRGANLPALDAAISDLEGQLTDLRTTLARGQERQDAYDRACQAIDVLQRQIADLEQERDRAVKPAGVKAMLDAAEKELETGLRDLDAAEKELKAAVEGVDALAADRERLAEIDRQEQDAFAADAFMEQHRDTLRLAAHKLRQHGEAALADKVEHVIAVASEGVELVDDEARAMAERVMAAKKRHHAAAEAIGAAKSRVALAETNRDRHRASLERAKQALEVIDGRLRDRTAALNERISERDAIEVPSLDAVELQIKAVAAEIDDLRRLRDRVNDYVGLDASIADARLRVSEHERRRERAHEAGKVLRRIANERASAEAHALLGPANEVIDRVMGGWLRIDLEDSASPLYVGDTPVTSLSTSEQAIVGVGLAVAVAQARNPDGWRRLLIDNVECIDNIRRYALLLALADVVKAGHLDTVALAAVDDGFAVPDTVGVDLKVVHMRDLHSEE